MKNIITSLILGIAAASAGHAFADSKSGTAGYLVDGKPADLYCYSFETSSYTPGKQKLPTDMNVQLRDPQVVYDGEKLAVCGFVTAADSN